jgi:cysteine-rich repeat protein
MRNFSTLRSLLFGGLLAVAGCGTATNSGTPSLDDVTASTDCTLTQGYWKNHPGAWPLASLSLGTVTYTKAQLLAIFNTPVKGNGLIDLAHQLIAAKLNVAAGASPAVVAAAISSADALIGGLVVPPVGSGSLPTSVTTALVSKLDSYNSGLIGPGHCGNQPPPPPSPVCGNGILEAGEQCDDGNLVNGDGCSSTCTIETPPPPPPVCGNGILEPGEQCDDGNLINGDGCSCTCTIETPPPPPPVCGNGILEAGEQCDDGNLINGDGCSCTCTIETLH